MDKREFLKAAGKASLGGAAAVLSRSIFAEPNAGGTHGPQAHDLVYVGTYTHSTSKGIYGYRFDPKTAGFTPIGVAEVANPSFLATDPHRRFLYAVSEMQNGPRSDPATRHGSVSSYSIDAKTGALTSLNRVPSHGSSTCHLVVDQTSKMLFVANYGSGSVVSYALNKDGSIGRLTHLDQHHGSSVNPERQRGPHPHSVVISPDNRFLFTPDLGLDQVFSYRIDLEKLTFTPNDPPFVKVNPGLGPRHFAFGAGARFAYVVCEMGSSVVAFSYNREKGSLKVIQTISTLPSSFTGVDNSGEIGIDKSGRFLYASNRGSNSITVFAIDPEKGTLTRIQVEPTQGKIPRNFAIDPSGKYLVAANQDSDQMVVFNIDRATGRLAPAGKVVGVPLPVCVLFVPL